MLNLEEEPFAKKTAGTQRRGRRCGYPEYFAAIETGDSRITPHYYFMRLVQFKSKDGGIRVGIVEEPVVVVIKTFSSTYELARYAASQQLPMEEAARRHATGEQINYQELIDSRSIVLPATHPDPYHVWVTGTGLTHLGSAASRDAMHAKSAKEENLTDSMRMFRMGVENGKMKDGNPGVQPEWFYKGNGLTLSNPGDDLVSPAFALDGGEEPEIAGIYLITDSGEPFRLGFALANEFSDHAMEKINYLYLAHSKLRPSSFGPELLLGDLPTQITGTSSIMRAGEKIWEKDFLSGEENMSHNIPNLEFHHFKYGLFRQPGDLHVHYFGTSVLSYLDGFQVQNGDVFQIFSAPFGRPLVNGMRSIG